MWQIKKSVLLNAIEAARNYYPDEFMCFLGGDKQKQLIFEIVFLPHQSNEYSASISESIIPFDNSIVGSLHSHPNGSSYPSSADKKFFAKHSINLIIDGSFRIEKIGVYNEKGERTTLSLIED